MAVIFALAKWYLGFSAFIALIPAIACSTLVFGLFMNRIRNIAASLLFLVMSVGYTYIAPVLLKGKKEFSFFYPEYLTGAGGWLIWFFITLVILGISTFIGYKFFNFQMPRSLHHKVLYIVLVTEWGAYYAFAGSWLLLVGWILGDVLGFLKILLVIGGLIALFKAISKAVNISWDLSVARNPFAVLLENDQAAIQNALPSALKNERDIPAMLTLAMKYAQCNGIMRNPQQCIRWCNNILKYLEGTSPEASLFNAKNRNMERYLSHMLLYVVYSRSTKYKNVTKAEKHKNSFDHSLIDNISTYWLHWSDSTCPFEDTSEYRFWGLPYKNLEKIALQTPDAYLTLVLYCSTLMKYCSDQGPIYNELSDLINKYMKLGIDGGSKACVDFCKGFSVD